MSVVKVQLAIDTAACIWRLSNRSTSVNYNEVGNADVTEGLVLLPDDTAVEMIENSDVVELGDGTSEVAFPGPIPVDVPLPVEFDATSKLRIAGPATIVLSVALLLLLVTTA